MCDLGAGYRGAAAAAAGRGRRYELWSTGEPYVVACARDAFDRGRLSTVGTFMLPQVMPLAHGPCVLRSREASLGNPTMARMKYCRDVGGTPRLRAMLSCWSVVCVRICTRLSDRRRTATADQHTRTNGTGRTPYLPDDLSVGQVQSPIDRIAVSVRADDNIARTRT